MLMHPEDADPGLHAALKSQQYGRVVRVTIKTTANDEEGKCTRNLALHARQLDLSRPYVDVP